MSASQSTRYFEDCEIGETFEFGDYAVTKGEIIEFAEQYDPQPFHVDVRAARESMFGGIIASGWHTAAICQHLLVEGLVSNMASAGGRGIDELRWLQPVRPGDTLTIRVEFTEVRAPEDAQKPGEVHAKVTGINQNGEPVISWLLLGMIERRNAE